MASITSRKNGTKEVSFFDSKRIRRTVRLGMMSSKAAAGIKCKVESILASKLAGISLDAETARWLGGLDAAMRAKLGRVGLVELAEQQQATTLEGFLNEYLAFRTDPKPATKEVWGHTVRNLLEFFGTQRELASITEADAEGFKLHLLRLVGRHNKPLSPVTVAKRLQFARQFFRHGIKKRILTCNPFLEVSQTATLRDRSRFITAEEAALLLEHCPTLDWRVIVSLCRYGGLRSPSEVLSLRWHDIHWGPDAPYMLVRSPKTERHVGHESRKVPIFPELSGVLNEAWEAAKKGAIHVVASDHYREKANTPSGWRSVNLRTGFGRIIKRAGLKPWERLFHALRSSRQTELERRFPLHVVCQWLGNSPEIARKHYLQVTSEDWAAATQVGSQSAAQSAAVSAAPALQSGAARGRSNENQKSQSVASKRLSAACLNLSQLPASVSDGEDRIRTCGTR